MNQTKRVPILKLSLLAKFSLISFLLMVVIAIVLVWGIQRHLEMAALQQEAENAADQVASILNPNLRLADLVGPLDPARFAQIDALIRQNVLSKHIVRIKIWNRDGQVIYSDKKDLVGRRFPVEGELKEALDGEIAMEISSLQKDENVAERGRYSRLIEIYVPLRLMDSPQISGVYEIYHDLSLLEPHLAEMQRFVLVNIGLGFVILYVLLFWIVRNASRELIRRNDENARLYEEAKQQLADRKRAEKEKTALEEQFRQSQKMEAIGQLAGGIAHDFNNLLTIISGYSEFSLSELKGDGDLRENLEEIKKAARRASDLTRQLLAFSRRQILEVKVLDLNIILRDLDKMLRRVIREDIELVTLLAGDLGRVKTDQGQIEQVIMNLAVNARDAMPSGGKLTIETTNVELDEEYPRSHIAVTPGRYIMVSVSDTGVGMTSEVKERVFEPFFTTKEKGKGTGLGLSTVYGIVKQSRGNIWVYSEPGHGTTFKIYLPQVDEPLEELKEKMKRKELPCGSETILVVEDDEDVRKLTVRILKGGGYRVLKASGGNEALLICEQEKEPIHLILVDVVMPGMSGRTLAERLALIHPEMKVLYMSGYTDNAIVHHGVLEEGIEFIQKPFTTDGLAKKVREVLDK